METLKQRSNRLERVRLRHIERLSTEPGYREKCNERVRKSYRKRLMLTPDWDTERQRQRRGRFPLEAKVEKYLVDGVKARGGMCMKFADPGRRGAPDRLVCLPGHPTYFVELKRPKIGKLDTHQIRYHDDLRAAGQRVWVIWSNEEVDGFFAAI